MTDTDIATIAARIRTIRQARGMTQAQLAARAGLAQQHVARAEQGRHEPTLRSLRSLASGLDIDVALLVTEHVGAWLWAAEIVSQMSDDDVLEIVEAGHASWWRDGVSLLAWDEDDPRPSEDDVLEAIAEIVMERQENATITLSYGMSDDDERAAVVRTVHARGGVGPAALDYIEANPRATTADIEEALRERIGVPESEGGCCPRCGALAELRWCDRCGREEWIIDCGDMPQPRPIVDDLCDDCVE